MDSVKRAADRILDQAARDAYDFPRPEPDLKFCTCGHEDGAHHGPNGELRCGEDGCPCQAFTTETTTGQKR